MTMRRATQAERIHMLEREMETRLIFLQAAVDELTELKEKDDVGLSTQKDQVRASELEVIMKNHRRWINSHKAEIKNFYKPAMVIAG